MEKYSLSRVSHTKYLTPSPFTILGSLQNGSPPPQNWEKSINLLLGFPERLIYLLSYSSRFSSAPASGISGPTGPRQTTFLLGVQTWNLTNSLHPYHVNHPGVTGCSPTLDSVVLPPPRVSYPPPHSHTSRFRPRKERGQSKA